MFKREAAEEASLWRIEEARRLKEEKKTLK
jgi:hypothetical protein